MSWVLKRIRNGVPSREGTGEERGAERELLKVAG